MTARARPHLFSTHCSGWHFATRLLIAVGLAGAGSSCGRTNDERTGQDQESASAGAPAADAISSPGDAGTPAFAPPTSSPCEGPCDDDLSGRPGPLPRPSCPESEPSFGDECSNVGERCGYGDARVGSCRRFYDCVDGAWAAAADQPVYSCKEPPAVCPPESPMKGQECGEPTGSPCIYDKVDCYCQGVRPGASVGYWFCYGPPRDTRCPAALPNLGEGCAARGVVCEYGQFDCHSPSFSVVYCFEGRWEQGDGHGCAQ